MIELDPLYVDVSETHADKDWLLWNLSGHVTIRVTRTGGANAVVSGIFFNLPDFNVSVTPSKQTVAPRSQH